MGSPENLQEVGLVQAGKPELQSDSLGLSFCSYKSPRAELQGTALTCSKVDRQEGATEIISSKTPARPCLPEVKTVTHPSGNSAPFRCQHPLSTKPIVRVADFITNTSHALSISPTAHLQAKQRGLDCLAER